MPYKILIADDEPDTLDLCSKVLKKEGYEVLMAKDGIDAVKAIEREPFDLLLLDIKMPGKNGMEVLDEATAIGLDTVMITAYSSVETAVEAMKKGARDYLAKPFTSAEVRSVVERIISHQMLLRTESHFDGEAERFESFVGNTPSMQGLYRTIETIAETGCTVLIEGESGTGKEMVARAIHQKSPSKDGPFIPINCGAIPETLLESELFGHTKGAFTGAVESKKGLFEAASNGTLFFDEIAEMSPALQVKLLRVLQDREVRPVGGTEIKKVDVRIVAATNKELSREVAEGNFRDDLFYRLSVISIRIPPLRERKDDIPALVHHFINKYNKLYSREVSGAAEQVMKSLKEYHWPGNVRELENVIERAVILEKGKMITPKNLSTGIKGRIRESGQGHHKTLQEREREYIETVLKAAKGNRTKAAEILGIGRRTLYDKIIAYGIKEPE
ncbi:MAG: sigma-54-dependent Fis family transcriptional regulator [Deltaproteobacteria bacterium]|nr:sigma-54-dependent Fis family transcriptional regulator [Deltaproteobacteria bacterium]